jgi:hypothetical protein
MECRLKGHALPNVGQSAEQHANLNYYQTIGSSFRTVFGLVAALRVPAAVPLQKPASNDVGRWSSPFMQSY